METIKKNIKTIFPLALIAVVAVIWYAVFYYESRQNLLVTFFDVGQGDAVFVENAGNQILIDGGPGDRILSKLGREMPFWDRSIDLLILTHPHADHLDGLLEVLKRYDIGMVLESGVEHSIPEYQEWRELLQKKNVQILIARAGQKINAGGGVVVDILAPFEDYSGKLVKNPHEGNVVSRLTHGETSILFMGDAERALEYRLFLEAPQFLDSDILKVGHHGSKTSSSEDFLKAVSPEVAIIQVGRKNRYGHPAEVVLDRLAAIGAKILRNDLEGDIRIESDGTNFLRK